MESFCWRIWAYLACRSKRIRRVIVEFKFAQDQLWMSSIDVEGTPQLEGLV